jgi:hypothetical protein
MAIGWRRGVSKTMKDKIFFQSARLKISFAWYDLWIGVFIDTTKQKLYFCPLPTLLFTINYG